MTEEKKDELDVEFEKLMQIMEFEKEIQIKDHQMDILLTVIVTGVVCMGFNLLINKRLA